MKGIPNDYSNELEVYAAVNRQKPDAVGTVAASQKKEENVHKFTRE